MPMSITSEHDRDLILLEHIESYPNATQATMAAQLGVAVGTINWHLKRLVAKGYVKVGHAERRKLRYIITPEGLALRAHLTMDYIQNSFKLYRLIRERVIEALNEVRQAGYEKVRLDGIGDVADICHLTCLEQGITVVPDGDVPLLRVRDLKIFVELKDLQGMH